ncbi:MAG TPA: GMC family oxidoreductase, partial [Anaerolineaceae bacterium]
AQKLTEAGYRVVSLEMGPIRWTNPDFEHDHDPLRFHVRHAMMVDLANETWTWRPNPNAPALPMRQYGSFNPGMGMGGSAVHWSGMLWRDLETDFKYRSHVIERYGKDKIPAGSMIQDWPVTYQELEPYYDQMEYDIGASGQAGNLNGIKIDGGNFFEAPRTRPYPLPPLEPTTPSILYANACREMGYHPFPQPAGIASRAFTDRFGNNRGGCLYCGFCTRYGCETDAKAMPDNTHIPPALKTGLYEIRPYCKVTKINLGPGGLATGVTYLDSSGQEQIQPADVVLLTGFTFTNNRLLLLSRSADHPNGVGNNRGRVGKNYTYQHWHTVSTGVFNDRHFKLYAGNTSTQNVIFDYQADVFDHSSLDFIGGGMFFATPGERDPNTSVTGMPLPPNPKDPDASTDATDKRQWGTEWKNFLRDHWDGMADILVQAESLPYEDQFLDLDPTYTAKDGQPLLRITFDWHQNDYNMYRFQAKKIDEIMARMNPDKKKTTSELKPYNIYEYQSTHPTGGVIMGSDPGNSVTNKYGQVWDTPNVFVTGACLYPQNPGVNPTGTLMALAYMAGDAIRERYFKNPNQLLV